MIKEKKHTYMYSYRVCYIFLIFKCIPIYFFIFNSIFIYLLHVLFILKIDDIFEKKNSAQKS